MFAFPHDRFKISGRTAPLRRIILHVVGVKNQPAVFFLCLFDLRENVFQRVPVFVQFDALLARAAKVREIANGLGIQLCPPELAPQVCLQHIEFPRGARILVGMDAIAPAADGDCQDCYFEIYVDLVGGVFLSSSNGDAGIGCAFSHLLLCQE